MWLNYFFYFSENLFEIFKFLVNPLKEFESIIRGKGRKRDETPKKKRKRPKNDPNPIVLSD